MVDISVVYT